MRIVYEHQPTSWNYLGRIQLILCDVLWPWMQREFIITHQKRNRNPLERWWRYCFETPKKLSELTTLRKEKLINRQCYATLLEKLKAAIEEKYPGVAKNVLFYHDTESVHVSHVSNQKLAELGFKILPHPPYLLDLASSDSRNKNISDSWEIQVKWKSDGDLEEITSGKDTYMKLEKPREKCVEFREEYVEK